MSSKMRQDFQNILREYGHDVILKRRVSDYTSDSPEYSNILEKHTVRHRFPGAAWSVPQEEVEGVTHQADMLYYFKHDVIPREGDLIYENMDLYPDNQTRWTIDYSVPMRGVGGEIVYWMVGCTREDLS